MVHESGGDSFEGCGVGDDCIACVVEERYRDKNRNGFKIKGIWIGYTLLRLLLWLLLA